MPGQIEESTLGDMPREKRYMVFIASTTKDLGAHRQEVSSRLDKAGFDVIRMEDWTADPDHPAEVSVRNIARCDLCIALIAFQRGTISTRDRRRRSITQLEIETAKRKGVRVLAFVLRDNAANREAWPAEFNRLDDPAVVAWRRDFERELTSQFFDAGEMPDVLPAVTRQIVEIERGRRARLSRVIVLGSALLVIALAGFGLSGDARAWLVGQILRYHDPIVMSGVRTGDSSLARLIESRADLLSNTNFATEILETRESFDIFANVFGTIRDHRNELETILARGARVRIVLTDFWQQDDAGWRAFLAATEDETKTGELRRTGSRTSLETATVASAESVREIIGELHRRHPDRIALRLNRRPLLFTLWLRDPDSGSGMAHLGVHYYGQKADWPAFRTSRRTGGRNLASARDQFERIWSMCADAEVYGMR